MRCPAASEIRPASGIETARCVGSCHRFAVFARRRLLGRAQPAWVVERVPLQGALQGLARGNPVFAEGVGCQREPLFVQPVQDVGELPRCRCRLPRYRVVPRVVLAAEPAHPDQEIFDVRDSGVAIADDHEVDAISSGGGGDLHPWKDCDACALASCTHLVEPRCRVVIGKGDHLDAALGQAFHVQVRECRAVRRLVPEVERTTSGHLKIPCRRGHLKITFVPTGRRNHRFQKWRCPGY